MLKEFLNISILVTLGKVLGFVKQSIVAYYFGVSTLLDIFFVADSATSYIGRILSQGIVQSVTSYKIEDKSRNIFFANVGIVFIIVGLILTILIIFFVHDIANILCENLEFYDIKKVSNILAILSMVVMLSTVIGVNQGVLERNGNFIPGQIFSFVFSFSIIISIIFLYKNFDIYSMAIGVSGGFLVQAVYLTYKGRKYIKWQEINFFFICKYFTLVKNSLGIFVIVGVAEICYVCDMLIAANVPNSNVSTLYYAQVASVNVINGILVTTLSTIMFPTFFSTVLAGNHHKILSAFNKILIINVYLVMAATVVYFSGSYEITKILFERGNFTNEDTINVTALVNIYCFGFIFSSIRVITLRMHLAFQDVRKALLNSAVGAMLNIGLSFALSKIYGIVGIVIATDITMICMTTISLITLNNHIGIFCNNLFWTEVIKVTICGIITIVINIKFFECFAFDNCFLSFLVKSTTSIILFIILLILTKCQWFLQISNEARGVIGTSKQ